MGDLEGRVGVGRSGGVVSRATLPVTAARGDVAPRTNATSATRLTHTNSCPPGDTPGETPEQMTARVDGVIARIRKIHAEAKNTSPNPDSVENGDVIIFSHGHFTRAFIARWCNFPIAAGYHFSADPGGVSEGVWARRVLGGTLPSFARAHRRRRSDLPLTPQLAVLGYQHFNLNEPCEWCCFDC